MPVSENDFETLAGETLDDLMEQIDAALGEDTMVMERTIDVHIRALRRKLSNDADIIETVRGVGYRFRDQEID